MAPLGGPGCQHGKQRAELVIAQREQLACQKERCEESVEPWD